MKTTSIGTVSESIGLNIHKGKSNILKYNTEKTNQITLDGENLEDVESFTSLRSAIDEDGGSDAHVEVKISKATTVFLQLKSICKSKQLSTTIKVRIFNKNVKTFSSMMCNNHQTNQMKLEQLNTTTTTTTPPPPPPPPSPTTTTTTTTTTTSTSSSSDGSNNSKRWTLVS
ncbi:unnamed protein product [Schistosoma mattheei]|uniref:Uncharacterized protein n=1 Tax=Schistosoma mattheei TaxID=31246 RepID=A0A183PRH1_9TREM|nr:unnamed protein product [Schistosoma mattheei]